MRKHHTKQKGDIGQAKVYCDLTERGDLVLLPQTEHAPFDLVSYSSGAFYRIQVKYVTMDDTGALEVLFRSSWSDKNGVHKSEWDKADIDCVAVYCPDTGECYYFDPNKYKKSLTLRVLPPKNGQTRNVKSASDYVIPWWIINAPLV